MISEPIQHHASLMRWSLPVSIAVHALVAMAALLLVSRPLPRVVQGAISVDIVSPEQYLALLPAPQATETVIPPKSLTQAAASAPPAPEDGMVEAHDFYARGILSDPANAELRENFPLLAGSEQVVQLCNMEALEQLRISGKAPGADALVGYAFGDVSVDHNALSIEGGAYRSAGQWFHIRYRCTVVSDMSGVSDFAYAVGELVPQSAWEEHFLNADDDWLN